MRVAFFGASLALFSVVNAVEIEGLKETDTELEQA